MNVYYKKNIMKKLELDQMEILEGGVNWKIFGCSCGGAAAIAMAVSVGSAGILAGGAFLALGVVCAAEISTI